MGSTGDDTLTGGAGDDTLSGGDGADRAVFSGNQSEYGIVEDTLSGDWTVTHLNGGVDGTDIVRDVELFEFDDARDFENIECLCGGGCWLVIGVKC